MMRWYHKAMRRGFSRPKLAVYGAAACGGCEMSLLSCDEALVLLNDRFELVFCPCLVDTKKADLEAFADGEIAVTLFNGAIRMEDDITMARLLRRTSRTLVAFDHALMRAVFSVLPISLHRKSVFIVFGIVSGNAHPGSRGSLAPPAWNTRLTTLAQNVPVDYILPGCPPEPHRITEALRMLLQEDSLPLAGGVIGADAATVCAGCPGVRGKKKVQRFYRIHEKSSDPDICLLDQGIVCMGIATRNGCGCLCPERTCPVPAVTAP
jgi:F420-non-reducing hydrogenase small subunit